MPRRSFVDNLSAAALRTAVQSEAHTRIDAIRRLFHRVYTRHLEAIAVSAAAPEAECAAVIRENLGMVLEAYRGARDLAPFDSCVLPHTCALPAVRLLDLSGIAFVGTGAKVLSCLEELRYLDLSGTAVTTSNISAIVAAVPKLEALSLANCAYLASARAVTVSPVFAAHAAGTGTSPPAGAWVQCLGALEHLRWLDLRIGGLSLEDIRSLGAVVDRRGRSNTLTFLRLPAGVEESLRQHAAVHEQLVMDADELELMETTSLIERILALTRIVRRRKHDFVLACLLADDQRFGAARATIAETAQQESMMGSDSDMRASAAATFYDHCKILADVRQECEAVARARGLRTQELLGTGIFPTHSDTPPSSVGKLTRHSTCDSAPCSPVHPSSSHQSPSPARNRFVSLLSSLHSAETSPLQAASSTMSPQPAAAGAILGKISSPVNVSDSDNVEDAVRTLVWDANDNRGSEPASQANDSSVSSSRESAHADFAVTQAIAPFAMPAAETPDEDLPHSNITPLRGALTAERPELERTCTPARRPPPTHESDALVEHLPQSHSTPASATPATEQGLLASHSLAHATHFSSAPLPQAVQDAGTSATTTPDDSWRWTSGTSMTSTAPASALNASTDRDEAGTMQHGTRTLPSNSAQAAVGGLISSAEPDDRPGEPHTAPRPSIAVAATPETMPSSANLGSGESSLLGSVIDVITPSPSPEERRRTASRHSYAHEGAIRLSFEDYDEENEFRRPALLAASRWRAEFAWEWDADEEEPGPALRSIAGVLRARRTHLGEELTHMANEGTDDCLPVSHLRRMFPLASSLNTGRYVASPASPPQARGTGHDEVNVRGPALHGSPAPDPSLSLTYDFIEKEPAPVTPSTMAANDAVSSVATNAGDVLHSTTTPASTLSVGNIGAQTAMQAPHASTYEAESSLYDVQDCGVQDRSEGDAPSGSSPLHPSRRRTVTFADMPVKRPRMAQAHAAAFSSRIGIAHAASPAHVELVHDGEPGGIDVHGRVRITPRPESGRAAIRAIFAKEAAVQKQSILAPAAGPVTSIDDAEDVPISCYARTLDFADAAVDQCMTSRPRMPFATSSGVGLVGNGPVLVSAHQALPRCAPSVITPVRKHSRAMDYADIMRPSGRGASSTHADAEPVPLSAALPIYSSTTARPSEPITLQIAGVHVRISRGEYQACIQAASSLDPASASQYVPAIAYDVVGGQITLPHPTAAASVLIAAKRELLACSGHVHNGNARSSTGRQPHAPGSSPKPFVKLLQNKRDILAQALQRLDQEGGIQPWDAFAVALSRDLRTELEQLTAQLSRLRPPPRGGALPLAHGLPTSMQR